MCKKLTSFIIGLIILMSTVSYADSYSSVVTAKGMPTELNDCEYNYNVKATIRNLELEDNYSVRIGTLINPDESLNSLIKPYMNSREEVRFVRLIMYDDVNMSVVQNYSVNNIQINFTKPLSSGVNRSFLDDQCRIYSIDDNNNVIEQNAVEGSRGKSIISDTLGLFAIVHDPYSYEAHFYSDFDENNTNDGYKGELYYERTEISRYDQEMDISKPQKDGYEFVKWTDDPDGTGSVLYDNEGISGTWYAQWIQAENYSPLIITLTSEERIIKGAEDGKRVLVTTSQGRFVNVDWMAEEIKLDGNDEVSISDIEQLNDSTIRITLSGNSSDASNAAEGRISLDHGSWECDVQCYIESDIPQIDSEGRVKYSYISENNIYDCDIASADNSLRLADSNGNAADTLAGGADVHAEAVYSAVSDEAVSLYMALYDKDGILKAVRSVKREVGENETVTLTTDSMTLPTDTDGEYVKLFLWDGAMKPLHNAVEIKDM